MGNCLPQEQTLICSQPDLFHVDPYFHSPRLLIPEQTESKRSLYHKIPFFEQPGYLFTQIPSPCLVLRLPVMARTMSAFAKSTEMRRPASSPYRR